MSVVQTIQVVEQGVSSTELVFVTTCKSVDEAIAAVQYQIDNNPRLDAPCIALFGQEHWSTQKIELEGWNVTVPAMAHIPAEEIKPLSNMT